MKDPAILFYTSDFLTGTSYFTDAERGQYIRLLCEQHQNGHIPENHMLSVCLSLGSPVVKKFIKDNDGKYYNERMEKEILKRIQFTESRRLNGLKGGRPKEDKEPNDKPNGEPLALAKANLVGNGNGNINYNDIVNSFNRICTKLSKVEKLTESRKLKIKSRFIEIGSYEEIEKIFWIVSKSPFLNGDNKNNWKATFDWIFENDKNWVKIKEGQYNPIIVKQETRPR
jgi:uncharacterized protein YdaU (DUF1376 family)